MKICVIPLDIVYADKDENIISVAHHLHQVEADTDIVVLPELFTTSFIADKRTVSEMKATLLPQSNAGHNSSALQLPAVSLPLTKTDITIIVRFL